MVVEPTCSASGGGAESCGRRSSRTYDVLINAGSMVKLLTSIPVSDNSFILALPTCSWAFEGRPGSEGGGRQGRKHG